MFVVLAFVRQCFFVFRLFYLHALLFKYKIFIRRVVKDAVKEECQKRVHASFDSCYV